MVVKLKSDNQKAIKEEYEFLKPREKKGTVSEEKTKQKKRDAQEDEKLSVLGQESEKKAVKWVQEITREEEKEGKDVSYTELEWLEGRRKMKDEEYLKALAAILWRNLKNNIDWPLGYHFKVVIDGVYLHAEFRDNYQRKYAKGIKVSGLPKYDHHALGKIALEAENTVEELQNNPEAKRTRSGLYLP